MTSNFKRHLQRSSLLALAAVAFIGCAPTQKPNTGTERVENVNPYRAGAAAPDTVRDIANADNDRNILGENLATKVPNDTIRDNNLVKQDENVTPYIPGENIDNMVGNAGNAPRGTANNNLNTANRNRIGTDVNTRQDMIGPSIAGKGYIVNNAEGTRDLNLRAQSLANAVVTIPEINKASVIVVGEDTALVGVNVRPGLNEEQTRSLNSRIRQQVQDKDNRIQYVTVTTSPELVNRINNLSTRIRNNDTTNNFGDEIREMIRTITPTV